MQRRLIAPAFVALLVLAACKPVTFGTETPVVTPPADTSGTADLTLTNNRQTDPGPLTFLLFRSDAQNVNTSPVVSRLATVNLNETKTVKVAAGRWKIAYEDAVQNRSAMPADTLGGSPEWPIITVAKDSSYGLIIFTDDGGVTVWASNLPFSLN